MRGHLLRVTAVVVGVGVGVVVELELLRRAHTAFRYASQTIQRTRMYCLTMGG